VSIFRSKPSARGLARFVVPALALLFFLSPIILTPAESAGDSPYHRYLPLVQSYAEPTIQWSTPVQIDASGRQASQYNPAVALDANANAFAVWTEGYSPDNRLYFSHRAAGAGEAWSPPVPLHDTGRYQDQASITTDPQGNFYVFWPEQGGPFLLQRSPTEAWSEPEAVALPKGSGDFQLAADARGRLHLLYKVWQGDYQAPIELFYSMRDETGVWHAAEQVNDRPGSLTWKNGPSGTPSLGVDGAGNPHAAWREVDDWYNWQIYTSDRRPDGSWSPNEVVEPASGGNAPSLAADEKGNLYLAFAKNGAGFAQVRFAYRPAGGPWQPSVQINTRAPGQPLWGASGGPSLQIDRSRAVYVIWPADEGDGGTPIYFDWRRPIADDAADPTPWHEDEAITQIYAMQSQAVASNPRGDLIAAWYQYTWVSCCLLVPKIYTITRP
jgi:hypothetical protein